RLLLIGNEIKESVAYRLQHGRLAAAVQSADGVQSCGEIDPGCGAVALDVLEIEIGDSHGSVTRPRGGGPCTAPRRPSAPQRRAPAQRPGRPAAGEVSSGRDR